MASHLCAYGIAWGQGPSHKPHSEGDYPVSLGEFIPSPNCVYEVLDFLGSGTFGQVIKCWKRDSNEVVAMKVLKDLPSYASQGQAEINVLTKLSCACSDVWNFVKAYETFSHHGHICLVFELLHINLYDYLKQRRFRPLHLKHIRPIAQQVLVCLQKLRELGLVHADLKPENIMLVDPERQPFRVKVIDFGSATSRSVSYGATYLQSRYYRAPETILGLPYDEAIDMWSLGCVLAELYLGWPLFPGASEYDQIQYICQTVGYPPSHMMRNMNKVCRFFTMDQARNAWILKSPQQLELESGVKISETRKWIFNSVTDITWSSNHGNDFVEKLDEVNFGSLLSAMLTFDPAVRITPTQALQTSFITMQHLAMHTNSLSVRDWIQCMQVCCHSRTTASVSPTSYLMPDLTSHAVPNPTSHVVPLPTQLYHFTPSMLAYVPYATDTSHHGNEGPHWSEADTGYVSADSSPHGTTDEYVTGPSHYLLPYPPTLYMVHPFIQQ